VVVVGRGRPERGGIATFLDTLTSSDLVARHDVTFLNLAPPARHVGGRVDGANARRTARDLRAVRRAAGDADVVHLHSALAPGATLLRAGTLVLAARSAGAAVVVHAHGGLLPIWMRGAARRLLVRLALAPAHVVVTVSEPGRAALARTLPRRRVVLVPNGVDTERFEADRSDADRAPQDPPCVLYAGVLSERKGVLDLLAASRELLGRGVRHELWLAGGVGDEGEAPVAAIRAEAAPHVRFLGPLPHDEMPAAYASADVFCLPSWWEAMPLSVLEAMAAGLPVVATDVGEVAAVVDDGSGFVVPPRDRAALGAALEALLTDPARAAAMGRAGRRHVVEHFSAGRTVDAIDAIYRSLPCGRRRARPERTSPAST